MKRKYKVKSNSGAFYILKGCDDVARLEAKIGNALFTRVTSLELKKVIW